MTTTAADVARGARPCGGNRAGGSGRRAGEIKTLPAGVGTGFVAGDVHHRGTLMAGALFGSPVAFIDSFFVEYHVSGLTGSVKE